MTETLAADTAKMWLLPTVDPHVFPQGCSVRRRGVFFKMQTALKLNTRNYGIWKKTYLSRTDFPQTKQVHFLLPPWVHSMCRFLFPVSLNCRPQISQGKGPRGEEEKAQ